MRLISTIAAGWLLVTHHGGTIAWYETKADCEIARPYAPGSGPSCVPDRFAVEEMKESTK